MKKKIISDSQDYKIQTLEQTLTFTDTNKKNFYLGFNTGISFEKIGEKIFLILFDSETMREGESFVINKNDLIILFSQNKQLACLINDSVRTFIGWNVGISPDEQIAIHRNNNEINLKGILPYYSIRIDPSIQIIHHSADDMDQRLTSFIKNPNFRFFKKTQFSHNFTQWFKKYNPSTESVFYNIDDLPEIRQKINQLIQSFGNYKIKEYSSPIELIDDIYLNQITVDKNDIIIIDNHMPYMTGAAFINQIFEGNIKHHDDSWLFIP